VNIAEGNFALIQYQFIGVFAGKIPIYYKLNILISYNAVHEFFGKRGGMQ
jgi:hypothetical protein